MCLEERHVSPRIGHSQAQNNSKRHTIWKTISSSMCILNHNRFILNCAVLSIKSYGITRVSLSVRVLRSIISY
jgi:hypothetical protein